MPNRKKKTKVFLEGSISITQQFKTGATVIHLKNQWSLFVRGWASDYCVEGHGFKWLPDQHPGCLNDWEESVALILTSANSYTFKFSQIKMINIAPISQHLWDVKEPTHHSKGVWHLAHFLVLWFVTPSLKEPVNYTCNFVTIVMAARCTNWLHTLKNRGKLIWIWIMCRKWPIPTYGGLMYMWYARPSSLNIITYPFARGVIRSRDPGTGTRLLWVQYPPLLKWSLKYMYTNTKSKARLTETSFHHSPALLAKSHQELHLRITPLFFMN